MNLPKYTYITDNDFQDYSFFSVGPKGWIKKSVVYAKIQDDPVVYNLAFGDEDPDTGEINDTITSNNADSDIVLATVANTIHDFCNHYGNHYIFATGSTPSRTRLYQMNISRLLNEISKDFDVFGVIKGQRYKFQKSVNYEGFLVKRR